MITSLNNQKIKNVCALQQRQKYRRQECLFVVEGKKMIEESPRHWIVEIFITGEFYREHASFIETLPAEKVEMVSEQVFKHMSDFVTPQGILAVLHQNQLKLDDIDLSKNPLIIALENLQDPGNIGTIIRTAEAVNAAAVIISGGSADIYNPKIVRATMGSIYRVPIIYNVDLQDIVRRLKELKVNIYAAHLKATKSYFDFDYKNGTCFLIGNEGNGLTDNLASDATHYVKIPLLGHSESLNAAIAAGVLMYEAVRQRIII